MSHFGRIERSHVHYMKIRLNHFEYIRKNIYFLGVPSAIPWQKLYTNSNLMRLKGAKSLSISFEYIRPLIKHFATCS